MADSDDAVKVVRRELLISRASEMPGAKVRITGEDRIQVEFRIDDLVRKLIPAGGAASSCGGCNGCSGCSM